MIKLHTKQEETPIKAGKTTSTENDIGEEFFEIGGDLPEQLAARFQLTGTKPPVLTLMALA